MIALVDGGRLTVKNAQEIFPELVAAGGEPAAIMESRDLEAVSDQAVIDAAVDDVLTDNPDAVAAYRGGDQKSINFLMGRVMRKTQGKANPGQVRKLLVEKLE